MFNVVEVGTGAAPYIAEYADRNDNVADTIAGSGPAFVVVGGAAVDFAVVVLVGILIPKTILLNKALACC
jgi:hypothetical protein